MPKTSAENTFEVEAEVECQKQNLDPKFISILLKNFSEKKTNIKDKIFFEFQKKTGEITAGEITCSIKL